MRVKEEYNIYCNGVGYEINFVFRTHEDTGETNLNSENKVLVFSGKNYPFDEEEILSQIQEYAKESLCTEGNVSVCASKCININFYDYQNEKLNILFQEYDDKIILSEVDTYEHYEKYNESIVVTEKIDMENYVHEAIDRFAEKYLEDE